MYRHLANYIAFFKTLFYVTCRHLLLSSIYIYFSYILFVCVEFNFKNISDEWLQIHCGVDCDTFLFVYNKYCGSRSIINTHYKLYLVYVFFKIYPTIRARKHCNIISHMQSIKKYIKYLSSVMNDMNDVWNRRHDMINRIPHFFQNMLSGSVDTFPVIVSRPSSKQFSSYLYNRHVLSPGKLP